MTVPDAVRGLAEDIAADYPALNVLINNAGIQWPENLSNPSEDLLDMEEMVTTNLLGPMRLTAALLPLLLGQQRSTIMNVTSGLAFLPLAGVPTYCATKAAMHSYTLSLRYQLRHTSTDVIELIPPYVQTDLGPDHGAYHRAIPLYDFVTEILTVLGGHPDATEVVVDRCRPLRFAAEGEIGATAAIQSVFQALTSDQPTRHRVAACSSLFALIVRTQGKWSLQRSRAQYG